MISLINLICYSNKNKLSKLGPPFSKGGGAEDPPAPHPIPTPMADMLHN